MALSKYLDKDAIEKYVGSITMDPSFQPMSQDSYNERAVLRAILDTKRVPELLYAAINMSCIGFGSKKFGNFKLNNKLVDILMLLTECGVKTGIGKDAKLEEGDLTPGRLCRAFRYYIRAYILAQNMETYLFRKYSDKDPAFMSVLFRGAEYLDDLTKDECAVILVAHERLDNRLQTNISERVNRVFEAKGHVKKAVV
jgi:hypothetical protein